MTISTTVSRAEYAGNGVTTVFAFPYPFFSDADLTVLLLRATGVVDILVLNTDYTVSGEGTPSSGQVTLMTAPASGESLFILRELALTQETDYISGDPFPAESHERALDRLTLIAQQLQEQIDRSLTLDATSSSGVSTELPVPEANALIGWNTDADGLQNYAGASSALVSSAMESVVAASTLAAARSELGATAVGEALFTAANVNAAQNTLLLRAGADIASAATVDFTARTGNLVIVTGTTQITAATMSSGDDFYVIAAAALPVNISGVLSYTCVAGDMLHFTQDRLGVQRIRVLRANDTPQYGECRLAKDGSDLKLSPYKGNKITIGGRVETVPSAGVTLSASGLTPSTLYYIYAYMNSGTMTLEASATGHSVDSTTGVEIKTGDATRTLVGMARPDTGPAWVDSAAKRFVRSWFNSPAIGCSASFSAGRNTSSTSFTELNTEIRNEFLIWSGEVAQISTDGYQTSAAAGNAWTSIGIDSTSTAEDTVNGQSNPSSGLGSANCTLTKTGLSEGYHYATLLAKVASANATWNGGATAGDRCVVQTYLGPRS